MPLEAGRIQRVEPPEVTACEFCSANYMPGREFVSFDDNPSGVGEDDAPGTLETAAESSGGVAYRVRNPAAGGTMTVRVRKPQVCSDCLKQAAELIGYGDMQPLRQELDQEREQTANLRDRLLQSDEQRQDTEVVLRDAVRERDTYKRMAIDDAPATGTAKRTPTRKA